MNNTKYYVNRAWLSRRRFRKRLRLTAVPNTEGDRDESSVTNFQPIKTDCDPGDVL